MCKYVSYIRVSTNLKKQDYERQKYLLSKSGYDFSYSFEEHITGGIKGNQRKEFNKMLEVIDSDTTVVFTESSRFGRNYIDCFDMLDIITQEYGATVKFLSNGIELKGGTMMNPYEWLCVSNFFIMDEFLKRQIGYNTKNTLQAKKEAGVILGRPTTLTATDKDGIIQDRKDGMRVCDIITKYNTNKATVNKILTEAGLVKKKSK